MKLISASQLHRHCGKNRALNRDVPRSTAVKRAAERGVEFHAYAEAYFKREALPPYKTNSMAEMVETMKCALTPHVPLERVTVEMAVGLSRHGEYVEVTEREPHDYVAYDSSHQVSVAGRLDLAWMADDDETAIVVDIKTGRTPYGPPAFLPQLMMLGLAFAAHKGAKALVMGLYYAKSGALEWGHKIILPSADMLREVIRMAEMDESAQPGSWCVNCFNKKNCDEAELPVSEGKWAFA